jgi:hypothetical protein
LFRHISRSVQGMLQGTKTKHSPIAKNNLSLGARCGNRDTTQSVDFYSVERRSPTVHNGIRTPVGAVGAVLGLSTNCSKVQALYH